MVRYSILGHLRPSELLLKQIEQRQDEILVLGATKRYFHFAFPIKRKQIVLLSDHKLYVPAIVAKHVFVPVEK
jgi:hypothetical protein